MASEEYSNSYVLLYGTFCIYIVIFQMLLSKATYNYFLWCVFPHSLSF